VRSSHGRWNPGDVPARNGDPTDWPGRATSMQSAGRRPRRAKKSAAWSLPNSKNFENGLLRQPREQLKARAVTTRAARKRSDAWPGLIELHNRRRPYRVRRDSRPASGTAFRTFQRLSMRLNAETIPRNAYRPTKIPTPYRRPYVTRPPRSVHPGPRPARDARKIDSPAPAGGVAWPILLQGFIA